MGGRYDRQPELLIDQIRQVHDLIAPLMKPADKLYFRAPYGAWRQAHADILNADPVLRNYVGPVYWDEGGPDHHDRRRLCDERGGLELLAAQMTPDVCAKGYLREIAVTMAAWC